VCLAYVEHYRNRAQAVVQRKGWYLTLTPRKSHHLFELLLVGGSDFRRRFAAFAVGAASSLAARRPSAGALYLNVGHTGLDEASLPKWIARHRLRAVYLIHDLIPLTHPQFCRPGEDRKHQARMRNVLVSAAGVIGNSQATLDELAIWRMTWACTCHQPSQPGLAVKPCRALNLHHRAASPISWFSGP
jgi:hypothetical protein